MPGPWDQTHPIFMLNGISTDDVFTAVDYWEQGAGPVYVLLPETGDPYLTAEDLFAILKRHRDAVVRKRRKLAADEAPQER